MPGGGSRSRERAARVGQPLTLDAFLSRSYLVAVARGQVVDTPEARTAWDAGARLTFALFLERECSRHAEDIRGIGIDLDRLREAHPWLGPALEAAGALEHVEVC